ncbi:NAPEP-like protein, partial [Mya arenaria]
AIPKVHPVMDYASRKVQNPPQDKIQITWIGHATVLVQIEGLNILADPVSYTRFRPPACEAKDLPPIDVVIISHNHHDHLDSQSVWDIAELYPDAKWLVRSGNAKFCKMHGCKDVKEMKWWEPTTVGACTFVCAMVWMGCEKPKYKYYFSGDSGYQDELFKLIGQKYGPFDLALIPIVQCEAFFCGYITKFVSMNPEEAVKVHLDIPSCVSIGINRGTFELTNEVYLTVCSIVISGAGFISIEFKLI